MGIYPFEDYENYSPYIHHTNDLIGISVNSFEMSQQYCRMNIGCLAELANPVIDDNVIVVDELDEEIVRYEVYDLMGRIVNKDVNNLESGIYIVRYTTKKGNVLTKKITK